MNTIIVSVILILVAVLAMGCVSSYGRVPSTAFWKSDVLYISCVDRVPREAVEPGAPLKMGVDPITVIGEVITKVTPEIAGAYKEVERNTVFRSTELYISNYTNKSPADLQKIIEAFNASALRSLPQR